MQHVQVPNKVVEICLECQRRLHQDGLLMLSLSLLSLAYTIYMPRMHPTSNQVFVPKIGKCFFSTCNLSVRLVGINHSRLKPSTTTTSSTPLFEMDCKS